MKHAIYVKLWSPSLAHTFELTRSAKLHGEGAAPELSETVFEATIAAFRVLPDGFKEQAAQIKLDQVAWEHFRDNVATDEFIRDCMGLSETSLRMAVEAQVNWMTNHYEHEECGSIWSDPHSCACDDECPECGVSVSPDFSDKHTLLTELNDRPGVYGLTGTSHQAKHKGPGPATVESTVASHGARQVPRPAP
ncbi:hypothetical protein [Paucibacter soli]|uniref:hypothetical protein n=1 Tax=Paucibacter soli TaxID=3133433 RepID=UPI0030AA7056